MSKADLEAWLRARIPDALDQAPVGPHIADEDLARALELPGGLSEPERAHLATCAECREVVASLVALVEAPDSPARVTPPRGLSVALGFGLLAAAAILFFVLRPTPQPNEYRTRGGDPEAFGRPALTIEAADALGRRVVDDGADVQLNARLSFRYGNASGAAKTLTVLGWDGERVHWYFPKQQGLPAIPLAAGATAQKLPFDIILDAPHRIGPLQIAFGFDQDPAGMARALEGGAAEPSFTRVKLRLIEPAP